MSAWTSLLPMARRHLGAAVLLIAMSAAAALRLFHLDEHSIWLDEANTLRDSEDLGRVLTRVYHPPLHYLTVWLARSLLDDGPFAARLPSALAGVALVGVVYLVASDVSRRPALAATSALLAAVLPALLWHGREARMYSLWTLLLCVALYGALGAADDEDRRARLVRRGCYWLGSLGAGLTHHYSAFYLSAFVVVTWVVIGAHPVRKSWAELVRFARYNAPLLLAAGATLVVLAAGVEESILEYLLSRATGGGGDDVFTALYHLLFFENWAYRERGTHVSVALGVALFTLLAAGSNSLVGDAGHSARRALGLVVAFWLPLVAILLLPVRGYTRLLLPSAPLLVVLLAWILVWPSAHLGRRGTLVSAALVAFLTSGLLPHVTAVYRFEIEPWNDVCRVIEKEERAGDVVIVTPGYMRKPFRLCYDGKSPVLAVPHEGSGVTLEDAGRLVEGKQGAWVLYTLRGQSDVEGRINQQMAARFSSAWRWDVGPEIFLFRFEHPREVTP